MRTGKGRGETLPIRIVVGLKVGLFSYRASSSLMEMIFTDAFLNPFAVASTMISPASFVEEIIAVIMPENVRMRGSWNDSNEAGLPLAPAR